ncbi:MAG TPA: ATP-binding cassette domain-containing protein, partial [Bacilli bacterium]|nr:ATP-binding cassette domain-containing protein [Bacilli bacterium]
NRQISRDEMVPRVQAALAQVGMTSFAQREPSSLSGGQKQRVALAGIVAIAPKILILDEATSSVDTRTEFNIQRSIQEVIKGRTSFVIAHRLQTIRKADIILVIHQGKLIEQGSHEELMAKRGMYYEMYTTQFQDAKV